MSSVPQATSLRRAPVQRRSAERLTRILDACADLLDEVGYDGLSTRAVAERAGVPIGSVYRFFGNKRQMADALAQRNLERYSERVTERLKGARRGDWRAAMDAVLDEYLAMKHTAPGFSLVPYRQPDPGRRPARGTQPPGRRPPHRPALRLSRPRARRRPAPYLPDRRGDRGHPRPAGLPGGSGGRPEGDRRDAGAAAGVSGEDPGLSRPARVPVRAAREFAPSPRDPSPPFIPVGMLGGSPCVIAAATLQEDPCPAPPCESARCARPPAG